MSEYLHLTTPEQSEQLIELGVPLITADFYYDKDDVRLGFRIDLPTLHTRG